MIGTYLNKFIKSTGFLSEQDKVKIQNKILVCYEIKEMLKKKVRFWTITFLQEVYLQILKCKFQKNLILYLTPSEDIISGGILSISSLYSNTKRIKNLSGYTIILATFPQTAPIYKYSKIPKAKIMVPFFRVPKMFNNPTHLMVNIPEYAVRDFVDMCCTTELQKWLQGVDKCFINIMLQNIQLIPNRDDINYLKTISHLSVTTAHERYTSKETVAYFDCAVHKFSVFISPEQYRKTQFDKKENLLVYSPDENPHKKIVLETLNKTFPELKLQEIRNMSYQKYKEIISRAKWSVTFGEGLDGYFIEPIFSGAISFSVYNKDFFTSDFENLPTIYTNYEQMIATISKDICKYDQAEEYRRCNDRLFNVCEKHYNHSTYLKNIQQFYEDRLFSER